MPVFISSTLIKTMVDNGNVIDHCPAQIYYVNITKKFNRQTEPMLLGNLFEHKALDMPGRAPSVPKDARTGKHKLGTQRLLEQAEVFKNDCRENQIHVAPAINTQVTIIKRWEKDPRILLKGKLDLFPTTFLNTETGELELSIIDLKSTGNVENTFGKFGWGNPEAIDHIQATLYSYLVQDIDFELNDIHIPDNYLRDLFTEDVREAIKYNAYSFRYMIYDRSPNMGKQILKVTMNPTRYSQMHESIRKVVSYIEEYNRAGWPTYPHNGCKDCPVLNCRDRKMEIVI